MVYDCLLVEWGRIQSDALNIPIPECVCRYGEITAWSGMPTVKVAVTVDAPAVVELMMQRLMSDD